MMTLFIKVSMRHIFFILLLITAKAGAQSSSMLTTQLDSLFQSYFKANEPGGAVLIVKDDKIIYQQAHGIADINSREPITGKTLFNTGSISKTFVAYGILQLAKEKKLSLDDNLYKYFPKFQSRPIAEKV